MDAEVTFIPITFRPIVLLLVGIWGWGLNLIMLKKHGIDLISLLQIHQKNKSNLMHEPTTFISKILSIVITLNLLLYWKYQSSINVILPYFSALVLLLWPGKQFYRIERIRFIRMLKRLFSLDTSTPVFFSDIILADILTSFSNVFGDVFIAAYIIFSNKNTEDLDYRQVIVPFLTSLPYLIRLKQCIFEYKNTKEKKHIYNGLKYISSIPVIIFSTIQRKAEKGTIPNSWYLSGDLIFHAWVFSAFINSMYSFWWDISMDWNLTNIVILERRPTIQFRQQLYFGRSLWYILAICLDLLLRNTWSFKLSTHVYVRRLNSNLFLMELFEMSRRWIWVIFRMESEWVKKGHHFLPFEKLQMNFIDRKFSSLSDMNLLSPIVEED